MIGDHTRFQIFHPGQHPYQHVLSDFAYSNEAAPGLGTIEETLDYIFAHMYPNFQGLVADVASLPGTANVHDMYRVTDDGDGKSATYVWTKTDNNEGFVKRYDIDWAADAILSHTISQTDYIYVNKWGMTDRDKDAVNFAGDLAGQRIYGGDTAGQHLILYANSGDTTGNTGFVQFGDNVRPLVTATFGLGTNTYRFTDLYLSSLAQVSTLNLQGGQVTDSSGAISFGDENLSTTGVIAAANGVLTGYLQSSEIASPTTPAANQVKLYFKADKKLYKKDDSGAEALIGLTYTGTNDNRLLKSDGTVGGALQESGITVSDTDAITGVLTLDAGNLQLNSNSIFSTNVNGAISLSPNGTGKVVVNAILNLDGLTENALLKPNAAGDIIETGVLIDNSNFVSGVARLDVDNVRIDGNTISITNVNGNLSVGANGTGVIEYSSILRPNVDNTLDLGTTTNRVQNLYLGGGIASATDSTGIAAILSLSTILTGVANGHVLTYNNGTGKFEPGAGAGVTDHGALTGLADDDHTQYVLNTGRTGGQTSIGGLDANNDLVFESTAHATKGFIKFKDSLAPFADAAYSGSWSGVDIGDTSFNFNNVYTKGEFIGLRFQNVLTAGIPSASAANKGRAVFNTETNQVLVDTGTAFKVIGRSVHLEDLAYNGTDLVKNVDVSATLGDARKAIIQLLNNNNDYERIAAKIQATSISNVRITTNVALPAGSYRLVAIE